MLDVYKFIKVYVYTSICSYDILREFVLVYLGQNLTYVVFLYIDVFAFMSDLLRMYVLYSGLLITTQVQIIQQEIYSG